MSFEMNNSWLNLTNHSVTNDNDERFNFKSTSEDFFTREGERFIREDPMLPFSISILTDITQNQDQSWSNELNSDSPGSTTTFFMAKSSKPDEMLDALLAGKTDGIATKENQQPRSLRNMVNEWTESSLLNKKSTSGLNLRQQKDSPFNEVSRSLFEVKPKSTSTSVNCDMLDLTTNSNNNRRHSLDLSDSMSILSLHCRRNHLLNGNIYSNLCSNGDVSTVNTETQTSHLAGSSSSSSSTNSSRTQIHQQQQTQQQQHVFPSTPFPSWPSHHPQPLFYPVVSYHPIYSYAPSTSTTIQHQPAPLCIHPPPTTISSSSDMYSHHHDTNTPIITSLHSQPSDEKSSTSSFQRTSRSSSSSLLSANSQRLSHHQLTEQHDHWWLDIPSSNIIRMPSCYVNKTSSIDVPIKNNGSVDIILSISIHKWDIISDTSSMSNENHQIIPFQLDKIEYMIKSQQDIMIKVHFCPFQTGNYQCKLNIKCQFCLPHQSPLSTSLVTLVGVCYDPRNEYPILLSSTKEQQRNSDEQFTNRTSSQSQVSDMSLASTTAQSDGDLTSTSQHRQKDAILDIANQIGIEQNILDFGQVCINDDLTTNSKTLKLTIKNYSRTDPCDVDISEPHLPFCISVRRATIREKSFVKLTCKFRPKKIGLYSENVILTIKRRNNFKITITLTGRCIMGNMNTILQDSMENEE
ncbi:unnamed protein product [Rotaria sp. Silwood1]|nr:unnamed protein product [Rotaria sp. Silwood1]CAF1207723.1 unnamed protein product [Rotaria sp. Silwood1]CAF3480285.1 unnamed protein product [Rotaria sp. Silwood1]CAF3485098.1 unnamed protein product [Rotaria sp. Silwood1]CAF3502351.1 unnamed protein product [Rotaria sp. Silwood1]